MQQEALVPKPNQQKTAKWKMSYKETNQPGGKKH